MSNAETDSQFFNEIFSPDFLSQSQTDHPDDFTDQQQSEIDKRCNLEILERHFLSNQHLLSENDLSTNSTLYGDSLSVFDDLLTDSNQLNTHAEKTDSSVNQFNTVSSLDLVEALTYLSKHSN
ncbi:hypothetical protein BB560_002799 [Smittium megazygosporum]|uniref:Uncharacterized protein n=1 Tax=Smittium megazygosporum TaxID=133381 RepID=A0A2T9ZDW4_9FUNG|nr:hypothetical protein BB560_002799 [Smittium megazygosporum]